MGVTSFLAVLTLMTLNDRDHSKYGFMVFFLQFSAAMHTLKVTCDEMAAYRPRQRANLNC